MKISAGILAGGQSRRMGQDKAFLDAGGIPLIDFMIQRLRPLSEEILIATRDPAKFTRSDVRVVRDEIETPCALSGIHAIVKSARPPAVFVTAVDMPYVHVGLIAHLLEKLESFDAVLPEGESGIEPLCAIYTPACVSAFEAAVRSGKFKITDALTGCNVRVVPIVDADWQFPFVNLNRPEDYQQFLKKLAT